MLADACGVLRGNEYRIFIGTNSVTAATQPDMEVSGSSVVYNPEYLTTFSTGDLALIPDSGNVIANAVTNSSMSERHCLHGRIERAPDAPLSPRLSLPFCFPQQP